MNMIECPCCGQDYLIVAIIIPLQERIFLCPECDAFWDANEPPVQATVRHYGAYVQRKGYNGDWSLLDIEVDQP